MDRVLSIQYQAIAQPPAQSGQPGQTNAAPWLYAWSEPVRQKIRPALAIALAASGLFAPVLTPNQIAPADWRQWWSEPVRQKRGLGAWLQRDFTFDALFAPAPSTLLEGYNWWSEPVRFKPGLKVYLQQTVTAPPRYLPTANVTVVIAATETNNDVFLGAVNVYNGTAAPGAGSQAKVSIVEVPVGGTPSSVEEG